MLFLISSEIYLVYYQKKVIGIEGFQECIYTPQQKETIDRPTALEVLMPLLTCIFIIIILIRVRSIDSDISFEYISTLAIAVMQVNVNMELVK